MLLDNKVALVTGAAQGIGKGIAEVFSAEGATVVLCDVNGPAVQQAAAAVAERTGRATFAYPVDVTKKGEIACVVDDVVAKLDKIDILVNSAGIVRLVLLLDTDEETWDATLAINLKGPFLFSQAVGKVMAARGGGRIINISSEAAKRPQWKEGAYCASKSGLVALTRCLALELGQYGINCNCICPNAVDTPMLRLNYVNDERDLQRFAQATATKRIATPEDVANAALFFASHLSDQVTGEILLVSGGDPMGE